ncbi:FitA-like ribbon-helix-helix domain-containing protein [Mycoplana dimorpha]|uniref:TraY domain-containing protein n=1 Tax=Mycoplana dimorpha TaxID=28320 RepID=A0A2T5BEM7_MYCDI|nr:TraY domain-containing protein [Mycoplana dimorpha]PTM97445.1 TraY domain-containing protein [Mycoplana dimorpha]
MSDLLLRGLDDALKCKLQEAAKRNGRSLSQEALALLRRVLLSTQGDQREMAGTHLRRILGEAHFEDDELQAIETFRKSPDRAPPSFE